MLRRRLTLNFIASILIKGSNAAYRILCIPLLLDYLGAEQYGEWMLISSVPTWLALSNMSIGSVAGNSMTMLTAKGDVVGARVIYSTTLVMLGILALLCGLSLAVFLLFVPVNSLLKIHSIGTISLDLCITWLGLATLLSFFTETLNGRLKAAGLAHQISWAGSISPWLDMICLWIALSLNTGLTGMSAAMLISRLLFLTALFLWVNRHTPEFYFSWNSVDRTKVRYLARKGLAFQAFPLGAAFYFQGSLLAVDAALGPVAVATFGTARTLVRSANQLMEIINGMISPEMSRLLGSGDYPRAASVHRLAVAASVIGGVIGVLAIWLLGQWIFPIWTRHQIQVPPNLLFLFSLPVLTTSVWYASSAIHMCCNEHEGLAIRCVIASGITVLACYLLAEFFGLAGATVSAIAGDLFLIPYVLHHSLSLTHDTWRRFLSGMWTDGRLQAGILFRRLSIRYGPIRNRP